MRPLSHQDGIQAVGAVLLAFHHLKGMLLIGTSSAVIIVSAAAAGTCHTANLSVGIWYGLDGVKIQGRPGAQEW